MNALLVYPLFPKTYWGMEYTRQLTGRRALLPPLGLLTVAALLPRDWSLRLVDMNVEPLGDDAIKWADVVLVSAMLIQHESYDDVIRRARSHGKQVIVGGPYATTNPDASRGATAVVVGECEGLMERVVRDLVLGHLESRYEAATRPDVASTPIPRYDLLRAGAYNSIGVQWSRGCPFSCEFCDIIEVFGRVPRTKAPRQFLAEIDAIYATGMRGSVFVVDDNFIGNKRAAREMLVHLASWMRERGFPFDFFTEASLDLAAHDDLIEAMVAAGFSSVFIGIETPSREALAESRKRQNLHLDPRAAVEKLTRAGLEVMAGFIVGFDSDDAGIFERQRAFIQGAPIPLAMVGILSALPGTQLSRRLAREGRLRSAPDGNHIGRTNFETRLPEPVLTGGYARLLSRLYNPAAYFDRCSRMLRLLPKRRPARSGYRVWFALKTLVRSLVLQGVLGRFRLAYWRFLATVVVTAPRYFTRAIALAVTAEHLVRYTRSDVLPALAKQNPVRLTARLAPRLERVSLAATLPLPSPRR